MKTISVSDEDFTLLMSLSKELQEQENDGQAFPYFWSPRSTRFVKGDDNDEACIYTDGSVSSLEEFAENDPELWSAFLKDNDEEQCAYDDALADIWDWKEYIEDASPDHYVVYRAKEQVQENNFSLFKGDVKGHIKCNSHHLGKDPHTYANTIFRMPKMEALIKAIYRLNQATDIKVGHEALRFARPEGGSQ